MSVLIICLTSFNVLLWIIFLIRFKKLFSTDKVVEKTADKINKMIKSIDEATERDLYLCGEADKRINQSIEETQKKLEALQNQTKSLMRPTDRQEPQTTFSPTYVEESVPIEVRLQFQAYFQQSITESQDETSRYRFVKITVYVEDKKTANIIFSAVDKCSKP